MKIQKRENQAESGVKTCVALQREPYCCKNINKSQSLPSSATLNKELGEESEGE